ncbi:hypothetical protein [Candidatus Symbiothrix dinenymphae]|uniref:hypothetical protein n=1 Tax=Candidatus Symbiothrix dinenymphae TaxID=467085 RepID=UPI0006BF8E3E|nr:hypothetical protein [Candidatus Symbiothrix dinenymphae]GAP72526.1 hypothetical protein SAMD00024442_34_27 [Candidatus Symbiothrix dinenymphae]
MESVKPIDAATMDATTFEKHLTRFLLGILTYSITTVIIASEIPLGVLFNIAQLVGLGLYMYYWIKLASLQNISAWYLRIVLFLFLTWQCYIVYHGFKFDYPYLKEYLFSDGYRLLPYLVPLVVFIPVKNPLFLQKLFGYIHKFGVFFLCAFPFLFFVLTSDLSFSEQYIWVFAMGSGLTLLTAFYHPNKNVQIAVIVMLVGLLLATIMARRNIMLSCGCFLLFALFLIILVNKNIMLAKKIGFLCLAGLIGLAGYVVFVSNQDGMFSKITQKATEDSRTEVFLGFFLDMENKDIVIGKGLNGTYYAPGIDEDWVGGRSKTNNYRDLDYRVYIECGYLQLMLNGGVVYVALFLLVLLPAIVLGLVFSKNIFSKGCALVIFLWLIDMVPFGLPAFTPRYFIVWFCVALCYSKELRRMSDEQIKELLYPQSQTI